jgi:hypothetical protein
LTLQNFPPQPIPITPTTGFRRVRDALADNFRLYALLQRSLPERLPALSGALSKLSNDNAGAAVVVPGGQAEFQRVYRNPPDASMEQAWAITDALVAELAREVAADNSQLVIVLFPSADQVAPVGDQNKPDHADPSLDYSYPNQRFAQIARDHGIPFVDMTPSMRAFYDRTGRTPTFPYQSHLNATGHALAAEELYPVISAIASKNASPLAAAN